MSFFNKTKTLNLTDEQYTQILKNQLQSVVDSSSRTSCNNIQEVIGVDNCDIAFGKQVCEANILAQSTVSNTIDNQTTQKLFAELSQDAASKVDIGFGAVAVGNSTEASNIARRKIDTINDISVAMKTDCVKDIQLVNAQRVVNSKNCKVRFADQVVTSDIVADCAVTATLNSKALQDLESTISQKADATLKGGGIFELILMLLMIPLMLFLVPAALGKGIQVATNNPKKPVIPGLAKFLLMILIFALGLWYPGFGAWYFGVPPWPYPYENGLGADGKPICFQGKSDEDLIVNKMAWFDKNCIAKHDGKCRDNKHKLVHYEGCGVFSGKCSDPKAAADIDNFLEANMLCASIPSNALTCNPVNIAQKTIPQNSIDHYEGCKLCTNHKSPAFGLFINEQSRCDENTQVSLDKFGAFSKMIVEKDKIYKLEDNLVLDDVAINNKDGPPTVNSCATSWDLGRSENCLSIDWADLGDIKGFRDFIGSYAALGKDECMNAEYQNKKRFFVHAYSDCKKLQSKLVALGKPATTVEKPIPLSFQCPPRVEDFMTKCDKNGVCNYSSNNPDPTSEEFRACRNDFEGCRDNEYVQDKKVADQFSNECKKMYEGWKGRKDAILYGTIAGYVLIVFTIILIIYRSLRQEQNQSTGPIFSLFGAPQPQAQPQTTLPSIYTKPKDLSQNFNR